MADPLLFRCTKCGTLNRVPAEKIQGHAEAVCGRCKSALPIAELVTVTDATFSSDVESSSLPVLVDLWAEWCGPCRVVAPVIEQLAREFAGRIRVAKLNIDENPQIAQRFNVRSIPTILLFQNGREVDRIVGAYPKPEIVRRLLRIISPAAADSGVRA